jgi:hypothetical protein
VKNEWQKVVVVALVRVALVRVASAVTVEQEKAVKAVKVKANNQ